MDNLKIQVILTSFNRPKSVIELATELKKYELVDSCIIVDSGNNEFKNNIDFIQLKSSHKNQPYQRFLGYKIAKPGWLLFLDDDMELLPEWDKKLTKLLVNKGGLYKMFALCFSDKHKESFLHNTEKSLLKANETNVLINSIRRVSGYPVLPDGQFSKNGIKGGYPRFGGEVSFISGGAFICQKDFLYHNFNMQLFSLYEKRMGKGEDGMLGYTASKQTKLYYHPEPLFLHNDQGNSVYTQNDFQFNKLVAFSRAYLNLEYHRLNNISLIWGRFSFINYSFWRLVGMTINLVLRPSKRKFKALTGYFVGAVKGMFFRFSYKIDSEKLFWELEAVKDLENK